MSDENPPFVSRVFQNVGIGNPLQTCFEAREKVNGRLAANETVGCHRVSSLWTLIGRGAVAVRDQGGSVALLAADPGMPHRLVFPIQVYRRVRNGQPIDDSPPSRAIALADLDGDGSDELIVATPDGVPLDFPSIWGAGQAGPRLKPRPKPWPGLLGC